MAKYRRATEIDKQYIRENAEYKTDEDIGVVLGLGTRTVERIRKSMGIRKPGGKVVDKTFEDVIKSGNEDNFERSNLDERELAQYYRNKFLDSSRYKRLKKLISEDELEAFIDQWIGFHILLEDVNHAEENDIEQIILIKLRVDQNQREYRKQIDFQSKLLEKADVTSPDDLDINDPDQAMIFDRVHMASLQAVSLNKDHREMLDRIDKLNQSLHVTRRQREEKGRVGGNTFFSKCQEFTQKAVRQKQGRMAELLRIATEKNTDSLRNGITFADGEIAPQLLDAETVELMEKQKQENKEEVKVEEENKDESKSEGSVV